MSPRTRKILMGFMYPSFYLFCLVSFLYLTFPHERLKARILQEFEAQQTDPNPPRLELDELSWYGMTGLEVDGLRWIEAAPASSGPTGTSSSVGKSAAKPKSRVFEFDHAHASLSVLRYLFGTLKLSFGLEGLGGELEGDYLENDEEKAISLELEAMNVGAIPPLVELVGLPLQGSLSGTVNLQLPEAMLGKANGAVELGITDLLVGDGKAKIRNTIALPQLNAGQFQLKAEVTDGIVELQTLSADGPDLKLDATGSVRLRDKLESSVIDVSLSFKFKDAYKEKNDVTKGLFGAPGSKVPGAFDLDPKTKRAKREDGSYAWRLSGSFGRPNFLPDQAGMTSRRSTRRTSSVRTPRTSKQRKIKKKATKK